MPTTYRYDWDPRKAEANLAKHKVSFEEARTVFQDRIAMSIPDPDSSDSEERWITIGESNKNRLLLVVHTHVEIDDNVIHIRLISARKPTRHERRQYEQEAK